LLPQHWWAVAKRLVLKITKAYSSVASGFILNLSLMPMMIKKLSALLLGVTLVLVPISPLLSQTPTGNNPNDAVPKVSPEKLELMMQLGEILTDAQKQQLQQGLAGGKEVKELLPTLDLSPKQKLQVLKILESAKKAK